MFFYFHYFYTLPPPSCALGCNSLFFRGGLKQATCFVSLPSVTLLVFVLPLKSTDYRRLVFVDGIVLLYAFTPLPSFSPRQFIFYLFHLIMHLTFLSCYSLLLCSFFLNNVIAPRVLVRLGVSYREQMASESPVLFVLGLLAAQTFFWFSKLWFQNMYIYYYSIACNFGSLFKFAPQNKHRSSFLSFCIPIHCRILSFIHLLVMHHQ